MESGIKVANMSSAIGGTIACGVVGKLRRRHGAGQEEHKACMLLKLIFMPKRNKLLCVVWKKR